MTYKIPKENFADKILALLGKKRAISITTEAYKKYGPYVYSKTEMESFWRALFRPKNQNPPEGWICRNWDEHHQGICATRKESKKE